VLIAVGAFTWLDQFAVDHLMPGLDRGPGSWGGGLLGGHSLSEALIPDFKGPRYGNMTVAAIVYAIVVAASALTSVVLFGGSLLLLLRRAQAGLAFALGAAFVLALAAEIVSKHELVRPGLDAEGPAGVAARILPFDQSYPSGHTLRAAMIAAAVAALWPHVGRWVWVWALSVPPLLVVGGWHTPTDVIGGVLIAGVFIAAAFWVAPVLDARIAQWRDGRRGPGSGSSSSSGSGSGSGSG
jgi:membrane-associated phospholipid phosphatase